jgi:hypothetical protein
MSIKGTERPTGVTSSNGTEGEIAIRVSYPGNEVGLIRDGDSIFWKSNDLDKIIFELIKVRDAMKEEGLL